MKNFCFLLLFISLPVFGQSSSDVKIDIGVGGERLKLNCSEESTYEEIKGLHYDFFLCERKGKKYLVRKIHEYNNYSGFEFDLSKKSFTPIGINEISKGDESLYRSVFINHGQNDLKPSDDSLLSEYNELKAFQHNYGELFGMDSITESKKLRALQTELKLSLYEKLGKIENLYKKSKAFTVKTKEGRELRCQKQGAESCLYYLCTGMDNYQISFKSTNLVNSLNQPYLVPFNQSGLGPDLEIAEILIEDKLFYKNTYFPEKSQTTFLPEKLKNSERSFKILTDPITRITRQNDIKACNDPKLENMEKELQKSIAKAEEEVGKTKLIQLIEDVNGILKSRVILSHEIDSKMCHMGGDVYFYDKDKYFEDIEKKFYGFSPEARIVPKKRLDEIYEFAIAQEDIPYAYYQDGCFARSHILSYRIEEQLGIDTEKIWARGPVSPPDDNTMTWNYHVATRINVEEENGEIQGYVLDPSVANRPLLEKEWLELISTNKTTAQMKMTWPPILDTGFVNNIKVSYTPNEIYTFSQRHMPLSEEVLKRDREAALRTNEMYRSYLNEDK